MLSGQRQPNNRAEMTAARRVLKIGLNWVPVQICTDSQLVVNTVLYYSYWWAGWERKGLEDYVGHVSGNRRFMAGYQGNVERKDGANLVG